MKIKQILVIIFCLLGVSFCYSQEINTVTISGKATDFDGNPIDSCIVQVLRSDFTSAYETYTDKNGEYAIDGVEKGKYVALYAIRPKEYPKEDAVPDDEKRLEFWAWNVIANEDLTINPRYHKLELYGVNAFMVEGGYQGLIIYVRPMSLQKYLSCFKDKSVSEKETDISVKPKYFEVKVFMDELPLVVNSTQPVTEYVGKDDLHITGYLIQVDLPKNKQDKSYCILRIEALNKEYNEKGESLYFYKMPNYK
ncbi:MAG: carboxypeptidase-like regulatory domain-containing protein [Bacteroidales bacterium]|jgi:hypothetical protein|nr:carboxypeptidase-like regulatory domain-containing protein [Bacteroidales bacterium]